MGSSDDPDNQDKDNTDGDTDNTDSDNGDDDSYNMGSADDDNSNTDDTNTGDDNTDDVSDDTGADQDKIKQIEDDLFKDLTPEQLAIKNMELKQRYLELYTVINDIIIRVNKIPKRSYNIKVLEFTGLKLVELRDLVQTYLTYTFNTKTYIENTINYQQYLATMSTINSLLREITPKNPEI